jgi:hypothetical protein
MHFFLAETRFDVPVEGDAEVAMQRYYESQGYRVLNNNFSVLLRYEKPKYREYADVVTRLFGEERLRVVDEFCRGFSPGDGVSGVGPGHPDLLVFRDDASDVFFCEVKQGSSDRLTVGEMIGISLIYLFFKKRVIVARLNGTLRKYRWVWPACQPLHPDKVITIE